MRSTLAVMAAAAMLCSCSPTELGTEQQAVQVCAGPDTVPGIDVSDYQKQIDWDAVKGAGYLFAFAQINDGTTSDGTFAFNWSEMKRVGILRGPYQFYEPSMDSAWQAQLVVSAVGQLGDGDLPVALDVEWPSWTGTPTAQGIQTWVDAVTAGTGKVPIIYTAEGYWNSYFSGQFSNLTLWVANYGVSCPNLPDSWTGWTFWQPGGGPVAGITTGDVDLDVFNGKLSDLQYIANAPGGSACSSAQLLGCGGFGCNCADGNCSGGFCPGTGCSAQTTTNCGAFGCNCVDGKCNGGYCDGSGCTAKETSDCANYGCQCVDHQCGGGFCPGQGCTAKELTDCGNYGCGCVDHKCNGGFCPGTGCTAKQGLDCSNAGQACASGKCVDAPDASVPPEPPDAAAPAQPDAAAPLPSDAAIAAGLDAGELAVRLDASQPPAGRDASAAVAPDAGEPVLWDTDATLPATADAALSPASGDAGAAKGDGAHSAIETSAGCGCGAAPGSHGLAGVVLTCLLAWRVRRKP